MGGCVLSRGNFFGELVPFNFNGNFTLDQYNDNAYWIESDIEQMNCLDPDNTEETRFRYIPRANGVPFISPGAQSSAINNVSSFYTEWEGEMNMEVVITLKAFSFSWNGNYVIGNIADPYRPSRPVRWESGNTSGSTALPAYGYILANGNIVFQNMFGTRALPFAIPAGAVVHVMATYPLYPSGARG